MHIHSAPCVFPRLADDVETARMVAAAGFSGCVLKGHAEATVERAARAAEAAGVPVFGGIVLNRSAGGLDREAVRRALESGARIVWMPTLDAQAHRESGLPLPPDHTALPIAIPPREPRAETVVRAILRQVAEADAAIASGHLGTSECRWLVAAAREEGVRRMVLTHPTFSVPAMEPAEILELAELGAVCEITAVQLLLGIGDPATLARLASRLGPQRCALSSDVGQPTSPPPPEALAWLVDRLISCGLDAGAARAMASETPERLVAP